MAGTDETDKGKAAAPANPPAAAPAPPKRNLIAERRRAALDHVDGESIIKIRGSWRDLKEKKTAALYEKRRIRTGIALSGGGIRSATISLGLIEALASRGRFYALDMMSTVSGGGYCGSFVRSLFVDREEEYGRRQGQGPGYRGEPFGRRHLWKSHLARALRQASDR